MIGCTSVLEFDPTTLDIVWQHAPKEAGFLHPTDSNRYYSPFISSAQRLPNGNTLITEGSGGRIIEVTPEHELVWEYISPYWGTLWCAHFTLDTQRRRTYTPTHRKRGIIRKLRYVDIPFPCLPGL